MLTVLRNMQSALKTLCYKRRIQQSGRCSARKHANSAINDTRSAAKDSTSDIECYEGHCAVMKLHRMTNHIDSGGNDRLTEV